MYDGLMGGCPRSGRVPRRSRERGRRGGQSALWRRVDFRLANHRHSVRATNLQLRDLHLGHRLGGVPYNVLSVVARRDGTSGSQSRLPLFFAKAIGQNDAEIQASSTAALIQAVGVRVDPSSTLTSGILPIAYDEPSWNALLPDRGTTSSLTAPNTGRFPAVRTA